MLLSRRSVIKLAAPALILGAIPRLARANLIFPELGNPFAFPSRAPGFNPAHPAAGKMAPGNGISAIVINGTFVNLLTAQPFTLVGTPTATLTGSLGDGLSFAASGTQACKLTGQATSSNPCVMAVIAQVVTNAPNGYYLSIGSSTGIGVSDGAWRIYQGGNTSSLGTLSAGYYFLAVSATASTTSGSPWNYVATNLAIGKIISGTVSSTNTSGFSTSVFIGNNESGGSNGWGTSIAAAMYSPTAISLANLQAWAADPWTFWYPRNGLMTLVESVSAASVFHGLSLLGTGN